MATIEGLGGELLEIEPIGYQFPKSRDTGPGVDSDANWLVVRMRARDGGGREWSATDPALLTWEIYDLIHWLGGVELHSCGLASRINFTEPALAFEVVKPAKWFVLQALLSQEFRPPGCEHVWDEAVLQFPLKGEVLRRFVDELRAAMRSFPIRIVEKDGTAAGYVERRRIDREEGR